MNYGILSAALWVVCLSAFPWLSVVSAKKTLYGRIQAGVFFSAGLAAIAVIFNSKKEDFVSNSLHPGLWPALALILAVLQWFAMRRFNNIKNMAQVRKDLDRLEHLKKQIDQSQKEFAVLKEELTHQETKLRDSVKFYSTARELAECVDFEQMKRVLERDLSATLPYIGGFALYIRGEKGGAYEAQIQHRLWLEREYVNQSIEPLLAQAKGPFSLRHLTDKDIVIAPIVFGDEVMGFFAGVLNLSSTKQAAPEQEILTYMATLAEELKFGMLKATSFAKVESLARVDGLTGLNRRGIFDERLTQEFLRAQTFKTTLGLLLLDIDHFKHLNDDWGHQFGDQVLRQVADIVRSSVYETDVVARYGGEEFVVILPRANAEGAYRKAEEIRRRVERETFYHEVKKQDVHTSISIGLAFYPQDVSTAPALVHAADEALYYSKKTGRNRVTLRSQLPPKLVQ